MGSAVKQPRDVALDTTAQVETPEHIRFDYPLAGPMRRTVAYLIDAAIKVGVILVLAIVLELVDVATGVDGLSTGALLVVLFVLEWFYFVIFEVLWSGRSPGKRAVKLRVVGQDGRSLTVLDSVLRNLLRAADFLPFGYAVGLAIMGVDSRFRRFGDLVAGTMVVVEEPGRLGERLHLHPPPTPEEYAALPARVEVSRDELDAIELLLRRRGTLAPLREVELAELLAPVLAARMQARYRDPVRFLGLVYARALGHEAVAPPTAPPARPWPGGQQWPGGAR